MTVADSKRRYQATGLTSATITISGWTPVEDVSTLQAWVNDASATVTAVSGQDVTIGTTPIASDVVTIISDQPQERTASYATGGYSATALNNDWDKGVELTQETQERTDRSLKFPAYDADGFDATLPKKADRVGRVLGFNATTGDPEAGPELADVSTLAAITADIATLADIEDGTDATDAIQTVAGISSNVTTVAGISSNVTTVSGISGNVTTVAGVSANVTTVAGISSDVTTVSGISANTTTVAGIASDVTTVATNNANVTTVAGIDSDVTTVAGISSDVTTVAADGTDIGTVSTNIANVNTVAGISSNVTTVAGISSNVTSVAGISSDVTTVATNVADVTNFADVYYGPSASNPSTRQDGSALQAGDLYFNTGDSNVYVYTGATWRIAYTNNNYQALNAQTGTTYTLVLGDAGSLVTLNNASAITLTVPANSSVAYSTGTRVDLVQLGAGKVSVAAAGGVTVNKTSEANAALANQYSAASLLKYDTDTWLLVGDLEAV